MFTKYKNEYLKIQGSDKETFTIEQNGNLYNVPKSECSEQIADKQYYEQIADEQEFLEWYKTADLPTYEKPSLTVDNLIFAWDSDKEAVQLLMIKRKQNPFKNCYALAGGFVDMRESAEQTVIRETLEETNVRISEYNIEQLQTFSSPNRDPRGRTVSIAYMTFLPEKPVATAMDDALEVEWFTINTTHTDIILVGERTGDVFQIKTYNGKLDDSYNQNLAFDHAQIIHTAWNRIQGSLDWKPNILKVFPNSFSLVEVRKVYAQFWFVKNYLEINASNFKKTHGRLFQELGFTKKPTKQAGRPSKAYKLQLTNVNLYNKQETIEK